MITPSSPLRDHHLFVVSIRHFRSIPTQPDVSSALYITPDGSATAPQPDLAHLVYPCNDHPSDKATFTFEFDVPAGTKAVANGVETVHRVHGTREYWTYAMRQPMATELTQISIGHWDFGPMRRRAGVPMRDVTAPSLTASLQTALAFDAPQMRSCSSEWAGTRRHLRHLRAGLRSGLCAGNPDDLTDRRGLVRGLSAGCVGTDACCTSSRTCGSATAFHLRCGAICG